VQWSILTSEAKSAEFLKARAKLAVLKMSGCYDHNLIFDQFKKDILWNRCNRRKKLLGAEATCTKC
jgi:hypothetical protein